LPRLCTQPICVQALENERQLPMFSGILAEHASKQAALREENGARV